jgi:signal transduction histidine kinase
LPESDLLNLGRTSVLRLRPRSPWRNRAPFSPEEIRRTERWLASARVFLAVSALVAVWMDPAEVRSVWAYALLAFYIAQGTAIIFLLRSRQQSTASFRALVHGADVIWPAVISLFTTNQGNPFFLFFVFVLAAAAYRWGLWETVMTAVASVSLLWIESLSLKIGLIQSANTWLIHHHLPILRADFADFEPKRLFMRSVYLVVMALLLGYLAEQQKRLRVEKDLATKMVGLVRMDAGLAGSLAQIGGELLKLYRARRALIVARESGNPRISVAMLELKQGVAGLQWIDPGPDAVETYLTETSIGTWYASNHSDRYEFEAFGIDSEGQLCELDSSIVSRFAGLHAFQTLASVQFSFGQELSGRFFVMEPNFTSSVEDELRFLQDLIRQISPAIYNLYLLRRLRRRAGALERARLVRELHDGAVQSLIGVEMQVDVLRRSHPITGGLAGELERIQKLLREEVLKLRELMQQMKSAEIDGRRLPGFLRDAVQRFQRETGIGARFLTDEESIMLPPPVCRELARIAQEALVNVRKHSGAKQVSVQLLESQGIWELIIEDDGAGFPFDGRVSQSELDSSGRAPAIIRERVRLIQGELTIESKPGRGARIEVRVPQAEQPSYS